MVKISSLLPLIAGLSFAECHRLPTPNQGQVDSALSPASLGSDWKQPLSKRSPNDPYYDRETLIPARDILNPAYHPTSSPYSHTGSSSSARRPTTHQELAAYHHGKLLDNGLDMYDTINTHLIEPSRMVVDEAVKHAGQTYRSGRQLVSGTRSVDKGHGHQVEERIHRAVPLMDLAAHGAQAGLYGSASVAGGLANSKVVLGVLGPYHIAKAGEHAVLALTHTGLHHAAQVPVPGCIGSACHAVTSKSKHCVGGVCRKVANIFKALFPSTSNGNRPPSAHPRAKTT
ncbi:hypothetical protein CBS101457_002528 [Exobasidium rhododendri]|nr:hypothetical protein CBS101457_002528 [Exobasidium rhododendri]